MENENIHDVDLIKFGRRIRELRKIHDVTQIDLANALGYTSTGSVSQIENGKRGMKWAAVQKAARFFGVSVTELLHDGELDPRQKELARLFDKLPVDAQRALLDFIRKEVG